MFKEWWSLAKNSKWKKASLRLGITHQDPKRKIKTNRIRSGWRLPLNHAGRLEVETKLSGYCSTLSRRRYHIARTNIGKHSIPRTNSVSNRPIVPHVTVLRLWRTSNLQNRSASADEARALCGLRRIQIESESLTSHNGHARKPVLVKWDPSLLQHPNHHA